MSVYSQAFVHDPLINWRLFTLNEVAPHLSTHPGRHNQAGGTMDETASTINVSSPFPGRVARERELLQVCVSCFVYSENGKLIERKVRSGQISREQTYCLDFMNISKGYRNIIFFLVLDRAALLTVPLEGTFVQRSQLTKEDIESISMNLDVGKKVNDWQRH